MVQERLWDGSRAAPTDHKSSTGAGSFPFTRFLTPVNWTCRDHCSLQWKMQALLVLAPPVQNRGRRLFGLENGVRDAALGRRLLGSYSFVVAVLNLSKEPSCNVVVSITTCRLATISSVGVLLPIPKCATHVSTNLPASSSLVCPVGQPGSLHDHTGADAARAGGAHLRCRSTQECA